MTTKSISFQDKRLSVRTVESEADKISVYKLRHKVYCEHLRWVPSSVTGLEIDGYDQRGVLIGAFREDGEIAATMRFILTDGPFMLETEFSSLLPPGYLVRKGHHTAEVTRLATLAPIERDHEANKFTLDVIFKGMYAWSVANAIRHLYFVVALPLFRLMQMRGFPCCTIGPVRSLSPGGIQCVAVLLDWDSMEHQTGSPKKDQYLNWLRSVRGGISEGRPKIQWPQPVSLAEEESVSSF